MIERTIETLEQFLALLQVFSEVDFFRGQPSKDYPLIPLIGRFYKKGKEKALLQFEREIFDDFKRKYALFTDVRPQNDKEFLFLAQHYGLPTRLLDWTYNPLIALFFSCNSDLEKDGVVYHCMPFSHRVYDENRSDILSFPDLTVLVPKITDIRYRNQNGLFTLFSCPWEEQMNDFTKTRYIIPSSSKERILNKMEKIGMTRSFIFPSLDSLCKEILHLHKKRYPFLPIKD